MAMHGVLRATMDLDFLLLLDDLNRADEILKKAHYQCVFRSENVSHYQEIHGDGRIDLLHAFRAASQSMLKRTIQKSLGKHCEFSLAAAEDIIGLKIQAACNNPKRASQEWSDIEALIRSQSTIGKKLDWELIDSYLQTFSYPKPLTEMRAWYDDTH